MGDMWGEEKVIRPEYYQTPEQKAIANLVEKLMPGASETYDVPYPQDKELYSAIREMLGKSISGLDEGLPAWYSDAFKKLALGETAPMPVEAIGELVRARTEQTQPARQAIMEEMGIPYTQPGSALDTFMAAIPSLAEYSQEKKKLGRMERMSPNVLESARLGVTLPYTAAMAADLISKPEREEWERNLEMWLRAHPDYKDLASMFGLSSGTYITPEHIYQPGWFEELLPVLIETGGTIAGAYLGGPAGAAGGKITGNFLADLIKREADTSGSTSPWSVDPNRMPLYMNYLESLI